MVRAWDDVGQGRAGAQEPGHVAFIWVVLGFGLVDVCLVGLACASGSSAVCGSWVWCWDWSGCWACLLPVACHRFSRSWVWCWDWFGCWPLLLSVPRLSSLLSSPGPRRRPSLLYLYLKSLTWFYVRATWSPERVPPGTRYGVFASGSGRLRRVVTPPHGHPFRSLPGHHSSRCLLDVIPAASRTSRPLPP